MHQILFRHRLVIAMRAFWYRLKLVTRQNVGVDKNFFAGDAAIRLSTGILPHGVRITCEGRRDGIGMQGLSRISGINFARAFGATYVHIPLNIVGHATCDMETWARSWDNLFNFDRHGERYDPERHVLVDYGDYIQGKHSLCDRTVLRFQQCWWLNRQYPDSFTKILGPLQDHFHSEQRRTITSHVSVALHVRRGDVGSAANFSRYTPNKKILRTINCLRQSAHASGVSCSIDLHSQGEASEFSIFAEQGCHLHLDEDALVTMRSLATADVLIMSKSSFSYVAALLNRGIKLYEPTFNPPMSDWITIQRDGTFNCDLMMMRIRENLCHLNAV